MSGWTSSSNFASSAGKLEPGAGINGVPFDGSSDIVVAIGAAAVISFDGSATVTAVVNRTYMGNLGSACQFDMPPPTVDGQTVEIIDCLSNMDTYNVTVDTTVQGSSKDIRLPDGTVAGTSVVLSNKGGRYEFIWNATADEWCLRMVS